MDNNLYVYKREKCTLTRTDGEHNSFTWLHEVAPPVLVVTRGGPPGHLKI